MKQPKSIRPAEGKLGVLLPGMGAVATTTIAGVLLARKDKGVPVGSLTQMGTIRLGRRTDKRVPKISEFVPLAGLDQLEFGGWDIFPDDAYEAADARQGPRAAPPRRGEGRASDHPPDEGRLLPGLRQAPARNAHEGGAYQGRHGRAGPRRHPHLQAGPRV